MKTHAFGFTLPTQHPEGQKRFPISRLVGVALILAVVSGTAGNAVAGPKRFVFTQLAVLNDTTSGAITFVDVFESNVINNRGDVLFGSSLPPSGAQLPNAAVYLLRRGVTSEIARTGGDAPGGGTFAPPGYFSPISLNDRGDVAFVFQLDPFGPLTTPPQPVGVNTGVYYRFSSSVHRLSPVVIPGKTAAPGGKVFAGASFGASLNARGDLVFTGILPTDHGLTDHGLPFPEQNGLGLGVFRARRTGAIVSVVSPGDAAPGGGTFDLASDGSINNRGDVAFDGHVAGEETLASNSPSPDFISALSSLYVKDGATGKIRSIAHARDPAPGGGVYRQAFSPVLNDSGAIAFLGDLTPKPASNDVIGVYLHQRGVTIAVARPGDPMPGGGFFVTSAIIGGWQIDVNNAGEVVFNAALDTHANPEIPDTGLYLFSHGERHLVARTGTVIPGVGTIAQLQMNVPQANPPLEKARFPNSGANNNERGQVVFGATLTDGSGVLLLATPR